MRAPPFAQLFVVSSFCVLAASCAQTPSSDFDSTSSPATGERDGGVSVRTLDGAADARTDAAKGEAGCVDCQKSDCPEGQLATACGCDAPDSDNDGTPDCVDECPDDNNKKLPGACGCGISDFDTDLDGVPDCNDGCSGKAGATYVPDASCGVGYCKTHNRASTCVNGVETACEPGEPLSTSDASCDSIDDDCDGKIDEDFAGRSSSCGAGLCGSTGSVSCVNGSVVDSCSAVAAPASSDASCDGKDDDCDGEVDEDYVAKASSCAAGACASTGMITCSGGKVVDSCAAHAPIASTDATCDNVDDDCDGRVDEDYKPTATKCGVGACASTGTTSCSKGKVVDSCKPTAKPSTTDTTCNSVDDDCNGKVDDGFASSATQCGQGVCAASGMTTCVSGSPKNSCVPGAPKSSVDDAAAPGNGVDDDCDGKVDEDVPVCDTKPLTFEAGTYSITVPGNCRSLSVSLWGGGGAGGQQVALSSGGSGGPGGFVTATALINGAIRLSVGNGGSSGCNAAGSNAESSAYSGGSGGGGAGDPGGDGKAAGGGSGGDPSSGQSGGAGHFGGGGGGAGSGFLGSPGDGGGGGAATVLTINGVRAAVAGGGGGGGGQGALIALVSRGSAGGSGCGGNGRTDTSSGGGGGGGGLCIGATTQTGSGTTPASSSGLPSGRARGGSSSCDAGGAGYAIVTFVP